MPFPALLHGFFQAYSQGAKSLRSDRAAANNAGREATQPVIVHSLSTDDVLIEAYEPITCDPQVMFDIPGLGRISARVSWSGDNLYGCRFDRPLSAEAVRRKVAGHSFA
jgi:hypothetical protein